MKLHSSTKIALGFGLFTALAFAGYTFYVRNAVANMEFDPVVPGEINLVGINPAAGYSIVVANEMAQLVQSTDGGFESSGSGDEGATSGAIKKRIPLKEMLGSLQGDGKSLGEFVMIMNDLRENDRWPTTHIVWTAEDLQKAFDGHSGLKTRLVRDLNMKLDGTPLPSLRPASLQNGIVIDFPIGIKINIGGKEQEVVGRLRQPYKPRLLRSVDEKISEKMATPEMMAGYYGEEARVEMSDPSKREDVKKSIEGIVSKGRVDQLAASPQSILKNAQVVINGSHIEGASYKAIVAGNKPMYNLTIQLTSEGRNRLWKYSMNRVGSHLLLIVDGVAIAAPIIGHDLTQSELTIKGLSDEVSVREAVDRLNKKSQ